MLNSQQSIVPDQSPASDRATGHIHSAGRAAPGKPPAAGAASVSLYETYNQLFESVVADTDELREECFRLRHQVYCVEKNYEDSGSAKAEQDKYDRCAVHALLRHRPTQSYVGTVRLIPHLSGNYARVTPVRKLCAAAGIDLPSYYTPETTAEISRFAISKALRRRILETSHTIPGSQDDLELYQARIVPCMALGLMAMLNRLAIQEGIDNYCAVMEPALLRLLGKLGMHFHRLGPLVDHHGMRQICHATLEELRESVTEERPDILEILSDHTYISGNAELRSVA